VRMTKYPRSNCFRCTNVSGQHVFPSQVVPLSQCPPRHGMGETRSRQYSRAGTQLTSQRGDVRLRWCRMNVFPSKDLEGDCFDSRPPRTSLPSKLPRDRENSSRKCIGRVCVESCPNTSSGRRESSDSFFRIRRRLIENSGCDTDINAGDAREKRQTPAAAVVCGRPSSRRRGSLIRDTTPPSRNP